MQEGIQGTKQSPSKQNLQENQVAENANWFTEAYEHFKVRLNSDFLISHSAHIQFDELSKKLEMTPGNTTATTQDCFKCSAYACFLFIVPCLCYNIKNLFSVPQNHFALVIEESDDGRKTKLYGPGYHTIGYYNKVQGVYSFEKNQYNVNKPDIIESEIGDLKIVTVRQGFIMHLENGGQNIILGPGIHKITEPMQFIQNVSLDSFYIEIGPEKWVTVPEGYDGIAINRGKIRVLSGGKQHHLQHVQDKFAKMVPKTLQTDRVATDIPGYVSRLEKGELANEARVADDPSEYLLTTTAEGATVNLDVMVFWKIQDTLLASQTAMEILKVEDNWEKGNESQAIKASSKNITMLRQNVLRMCKHHITTLVGACSLGGKSSLQSQAPKMKVPQNLIEEEDEDNFSEEIGQNKFEQENEQDQEQDLAEQNITQINDENDKLIQENFNIIKKKPAAQQPLSKQNSSNQQLNQQQIKSKNSKKPRVIEYPKQQLNENSGAFAISTFLQNEMIQLKDIINYDLVKIGCHLENICVYSVSPTKQIQQELDRQTKARVDANTEIIYAMSRKEVTDIEQEVTNLVSEQKATTNQKVEQIRAESAAYSETTRANGDAESIRVIAQARKEEAKELQSVQIAQELASIRVLGEAGEKIFKGEKNSFVYGKNPGDVLFSMFGKQIKN